MTRRPDPEWQRQADAEPFRLAYSVMRKLWTVYDCRLEDDPEPFGPFRSRQRALDKAAALNADAVREGVA